MMAKVLQKLRKDRKGFSLVELIIVIAIMAVLIAILAPQFLKYVERSREAKDRSAADEILRAVQTAYMREDIKVVTGTTVVWTPSKSGDNVDVTLTSTDTSKQNLIDEITDTLGTLAVKGSSSKALSATLGTGSTTVTYTVSVEPAGTGKSAKITGTWNLGGGAETGGWK